MAEKGGQERTEQPTSKRLQEARDKGQIARSRELNTAMVLLTGAITMLLLGGKMIDGLLDIMRGGFTLSRAQVFDDNSMALQIKHAVTMALTSTAPLLGLLLLAAILAPLALGGWAFSPQAMGFKWEKLDPVKGLGRVFAWRGVMELIKALAKFCLIAMVAIFMVWLFFDRFYLLGAQEVHQGLGNMGNLLLWCFVALSASMLLVAAIDVPFQLWDHRNKLKMTRQEVKDEQKQTEGSPEVRGRIRRLQQEMAQRRMMTEVPKADVIVTNPTHYAVALRYDPDNMRAPQVVAKGADHMAAQIRAIGRKHRVTTLSSPALTRALYYHTQLGHEIPDGLYQAVAQVLAYVFQLKQPGSDGKFTAAALRDLPIPNGLRRDS